MQVAKSTKDSELFLRRNPSTVRVSTENSKDAVILARCAVFGPATAEFRFNRYTPSRICHLFGASPHLRGAIFLHLQGSLA